MRHFDHHDPTPHKVVLIVDDAPEILSLNKLILELEGLTVFTSRNSREAFAILSEINRPDLILVDMQMDNETGIDFLETLEERMPEIVDRVPIVFLTAMSDVPKSRACGFIRKAIDNDEFVAQVNRFIEMGARKPRSLH
jgi:CheY-like chemotaxis protein